MRQSPLFVATRCILSCSITASMAAGYRAERGVSHLGHAMDDFSWSLKCQSRKNGNRLSVPVVGLSLVLIDLARRKRPLAS